LDDDDEELSSDDEEVPELDDGGEWAFRTCTLWIAQCEIIAHFT
jgi:hypothetical protein